MLKNSFVPDVRSLSRCFNNVRIQPHVSFPRAHKHAANYKNCANESTTCMKHITFLTTDFYKVSLNETLTPRTRFETASYSNSIAIISVPISLLHINDQDTII
jgi:hypothetical protein